MLFPTATFAIFFLVVLPLSWLAMPRPHRWRPFIIAASYVFYGWWDWRFVFLLAGCTSGTSCSRCASGGRRSAPGASALLVLALAGEPRRARLLQVLRLLRHLERQHAARSSGSTCRSSLRTIVLPVGISFFTFMAISYVVDAYRGDFEPTTLEKFAVYLSFFPHLVAGPIVRPGELDPADRRRRATRAASTRAAPST